MTFLFTDIVGSTPLWDSFPDVMGVALARHDEIVRSAIDANSGGVFSTGGDGFGAVFGRAADAIGAALAAQRDLLVEEWVGGPVLRVRMGIHTGEAEERDGDYFGPPVNRAARIMGAANGGQVIVSDLTAGLVERMADVKVVDLGSVELKGVVEPVHVYGVAGGGHEWIDVPLLTGQIGRGNLPRLQTESVRDVVELQRRATLLAHDSPTVAATIHGHLEHSKPLWGHIGNIMRAMATELVNAIPDADIHRARGATMDRHEIVALTLATLEQS